MSMPISGVSTAPAPRPSPAPEPAAADGAGQPAAAGRGARWRRMARAVRSNRKATAGAVLLAHLHASSRCSPA